MNSNAVTLALKRRNSYIHHKSFIKKYATNFPIAFQGKRVDDTQVSVKQEMQVSCMRGGPHAGGLCCAGNK